MSHCVWLRYRKASVNSVHRWRVPSPNASSPFTQMSMGRGSESSHSWLITFHPFFPSAQASSAPSCSGAGTGLTSYSHASGAGHEPFPGWQLWAPGPKATSGPPLPMKLPPPRCSPLAGLADWARAGGLAHGSHACRQTVSEMRAQMVGCRARKRQRAAKWAWKGGHPASFPHNPLLCFVLSHYFLGVEYKFATFRAGPLSHISMFSPLPSTALP